MKHNIIFLDCTQNYTMQYSASNTKIEFLAKGLVEQGDVCTIHNGINGASLSEETIVLKKEDIGTVVTYKQKGNKHISWILNYKKLKKDLIKLYNEDCSNIVVLVMPIYHIFRIYVKLARKIGYKVVSIAHEWPPTVNTIHPIKRPFFNLTSLLFGKYVDGILPISEYIIDKIRHFEKPYLKVPILADFSFTPQFKNGTNDYFIYCVYAAYRRIILPIIRSFHSYLKCGGSHSLILILSGSQEDIEQIKTYIQNLDLGNRILIKSKVQYNELYELYSNASGLIIPLDPNSEQDKARFSQKIAEYLSSGSPLISNNVGEIEYYFKDKENIILCDYEKGWSKIFHWVSNNPEEARRIGLKGYETGKKYFNYHTFGRIVHDFFDTL